MRVLLVSRPAVRCKAEAERSAEESAPAVALTPQSSNRRARVAHAEPAGSAPFNLAHASHAPRPDRNLSRMARRSVISAARLIASASMARSMTRAKPNVSGEYRVQTLRKA